MPTYEYECEKCGYKFEEFQSIKAEPLKKCPKCKGKLRRLIGTGAGLIFKGSGFYITDYKKKKDGDAAKASQPKSSSCSTCSTGKCSSCKPR